MKNSKRFKYREKRPRATIFRAPLAAIPTQSSVLPTAPNLGEVIDCGCFDPVASSVLPNPPDLGKAIDCGVFDAKPDAKPVPQFSPAQKIIIAELNRFHRDVQKLFIRAKHRMMVVGLREGAAARQDSQK